MWGGEEEKNNSIKKHLKRVLREYSKDAMLDFERGSLIGVFKNLNIQG